MKSSKQNSLPVALACIGVGILAFFPYALLWLITRPTLANNIGFFAPMTILLGIVTLFSGIPLGLLGILFGIFAITQNTDQFIMTSLGILFNILGIISHIQLFDYIIEIINSGNLLT